MATVNRIPAKEAKALVDSDMSLLVCIYDDDKFRDQAHLEGALPMSEFLRMKPDLPKETGIIFY